MTTLPIDDKTFTGIIPARYASSRLPGKVLCDLDGKPMIQRVYESVKKWPNWTRLLVATDSDIVVNACKDLGIESMITSDKHLDCLDRSAEVAQTLENEGKGTDRYIIIQGDEPLFNIKTLEADYSHEVINFYTEVQDPEELDNRNAVKVVVSDCDTAVYFSRLTLPFDGEKTRRSTSPRVVYKQIGVYAFSGRRLKLYASSKPSYLECMEGIGLNRFISYNIPIVMQYTPFDSISVDTEEDRLRIIKLIKNEQN